MNCNIIPILPIKFIYCHQNRFPDNSIEDCRRVNTKWTLLLLGSMIDWIFIVFIKTYFHYFRRTLLLFMSSKNWYCENFSKKSEFILPSITRTVSVSKFKMCSGDPLTISVKTKNSSSYKSLTFRGCYKCSCADRLKLYKNSMSKLRPLRKFPSLSLS